MTEPKEEGPKKPGDEAEDQVSQTPTDEETPPDDKEGSPQSAPEGDSADGTEGDGERPDDAPADGESVEADTSEAADDADKAETETETETDTESAAGTEESAASDDQTPPENGTPEEGTDPGEDEMTEDERREMAEAALRDAERGRFDPDEPQADTQDLPDDSPAPAPKDTGPAAVALAEPVREIVVEKRGGVLSGVIGGAIAVVGSLFAAPYVLPESMRPITSLAPVETGIATQGERIDVLTNRIDGLSGQVEGIATTAEAAAPADAVSTFADRLSAMEADIAAQAEALNTRVDALAAAWEAFERSPIEDAADPAVVAALDAFRSEVADIRAAVEAQTAENQRALEAQTAENQRVIEEAAAATAEARAMAEAEAAAAEERALRAARMQAMADIKTALDDGVPFAAPLQELGDTAPDALSASADEGVPTLASLQASFSEPARAALGAARRASAEGDPAERGLSFLQTQLGMRSLAPKEGDSVDAILSRAEAAALDGDLSTAVSELAALPEPALSEMQGWIDRATARAEALAAADDLAQSLANN